MNWVPFASAAIIAGVLSFWLFYWYTFRNRP